MKNTKIKLTSKEKGEEKKVLFNREDALKEVTAVLAENYCDLAELWSRWGDRPARLFINFDVGAFYNKKSPKMLLIDRWTKIFFEYIDPSFREERPLHFEIMCGISHELKEEETRVYSIGIEFDAGRIIRYEAFQLLGSDVMTVHCTIDRDVSRKACYVHLNGGLSALKELIVKDHDGSNDLSH